MSRLVLRTFDYAKQHEREDQVDMDTIAVLGINKPDSNVCAAFIDAGYSEFAVKLFWDQLRISQDYRCKLLPAPSDVQDADDIFLVVAHVSGQGRVSCVRWFQESKQWKCLGCKEDTAMGFYCRHCCAAVAWSGSFIGMFGAMPQASFQNAIRPRWRRELPAAGGRINALNRVDCVSHASTGSLQTGSYKIRTNLTGNSIFA